MLDKLFNASIKVLKLLNYVSFLIVILSLTSFNKWTPSNTPTYMIILYGFFYGLSIIFLNGITKYKKWALNGYLILIIFTFLSYFKSTVILYYSIFSLFGWILSFIYFKRNVELWE